MKPATNGKAGDQDGRDKSKAKRRSGDRFAVLNAFVDFTAGDLDRGEIVVWLILFRDTRDGLAETAASGLPTQARPTQRSIAVAKGTSWK